MRLRLGGLLRGLLVRDLRLSLLHLLLGLGGLLLSGLELLLGSLELGLGGLDLLLLLDLLEHLGELLWRNAAERLWLLGLWLLLEHRLLLHLLRQGLLGRRLGLLGERVEQIERRLLVATVVGVLRLAHHLG